LSGGGSGSFDFPNASTPTLTVTKSGNYSIILTVTTISGGCSNAYEQKITVTLPVADFYYTTPVCVGNPELFTAQSTGTGLQYIWNFGDGTTSYKDPTNHSYQIAGIYTVNLKVNDEMGCADQTSKQIEVKPTPVCTITAPDTIFCPGNSVPITACTGMSTYQWFRDGKLISGATTNMFHAVKQGSYWVAATNSYGCETISDTVNIYMERLPVAKITGDEYICTTAGVPPHIHLSTPDSSNYTYQWYKENSGIFTALPGATLSIYDGNGSLPANTTGQYIFSVVVTDKNTLCTASDTICITFSTAPQVHVPYLWGCEGTSFTFSSSDDPGQYDFYWSNGATTQKITTSLPGDYFVSIVDKLTGCCSTPKLAGRIYPKPDLSLFPLGCDTLCDTMHLYVPLALLPGWPDYPNYCPSPYTINWYDNQNYTTSIGTGCKFSLTGLTGLHHISVIVTNNYNCTDTSAIYCPFIKSCTHPQGCKNCCDDFTIKIASVLEKVNSRWIVKSHLTTGPYKLYEIKAAIVNFYMNNQAGCERCITPTMDFGSMMPLAAGSTPTSQINWAPPSGPWVDPVLTHYTTGDLYTSPREFVWHKLNNGQLVPRLPLSNDYVGFQVIIPAVYPNNCCTDTIHFCIRYSFSDTTCRVCDSMKCYTIIQQYPGINSLQIQNENRQNWEIDLQNLEQNKQMMIIPKKNKINK
jgi:PKD repeat protein